MEQHTEVKKLEKMQEKAQKVYFAVLAAVGLASMIFLLEV